MILNPIQRLSTIPKTDHDMIAVVRLGDMELTTGATWVGFDSINCHSVSMSGETGKLNRH